MPRNTADPIAAMLVIAATIIIAAIDDNKNP